MLSFPRYSAPLAYRAFTFSVIALLMLLASAWPHSARCEQVKAKTVGAAVQLSAIKIEKDHLAEIGRTSLPHLKGRLNDSGEQRSIKLGRLVSGTASADFFVILACVPGTSDGKVEEVGFIKGSDELKSAFEKLKSARFNSVFPDDGPTHLVRRGILGCYPNSGCTFVLLDANDVRSLN